MAEVEAKDEDTRAAVKSLLAQFDSSLREQCPGWDPEDTCERFLTAQKGDRETAGAMLEVRSLGIAPSDGLLATRTTPELALSTCAFVDPVSHPQESLAWRKMFVEGGVSTLLNYHLEEEEEVRQGFPQCFHKTDRIGRPVQYFAVGQADPEKLAASTTLERLLRWNVHRAEHTIRVKYPRCSAAAGSAVSNSVVIIDLDGAYLSQFSMDVRAYLKLYFQLLGNNYPGNLGKVFIINCPMVFTGVWSVVRLFLPVLDRERIQLFGGPATYEPVLAAEIDPANLPTRYGGTDATLSPLRDGGQWDDIVATGEEEVQEEVSRGVSPSSVLPPAPAAERCDFKDAERCDLKDAERCAPPEPPATLLPPEPEII